MKEIIYSAYLLFCSNFLFVLITFIFCFFRLRLLMLFFQQKEYRNNWFLKFYLEKGRLIDKKLTASLLAICVLKYCLSSKNVSFDLLDYFVIPALMALSFIIFGVYEAKYLEKAKKKLVITERVKRILRVALVLNAVISVLIFSLVSCVLLSSIVVIQLLPLILILANLILAPNEKKIQTKFKNEAIEKIKKLDPIVIGITGSYGKTSTKHILGHILSGNLPILFTPGSVNTEMGVTRIIREKLEPNHKYFIVEMGAYFKGSIEKLCNLTNPKHGIITSIGQAHYEYFKTQETIAAAKFELGECVAKNNGTLVVNTSQIEERFIPENISVVKVGEGSKINVANLKQEKDGIYFDFIDESGSYPIFAPIYGLHQVINIALAIEMALKLGMPINTIIATLKTLPQVNHRLEVLNKENGTIVIDDAYNSNERGFESGLELLQVLGENRRILVTPGMVELGAKHDETHYEVGKFAGARVDIAIVVNSDRIPTFVKGIEETSNGKAQIIKVNSFAEAQDWMNKNLQKGDAVLLENDLTDIYESKFCL